MTSPADALRAERFDEIGAILQRDCDAIIERWADRAAVEQPTARGAHREVLLDHLQKLLRELGAQLAESGAPGDCPHCRPAAEHGEQRWGVGWSLAEVVRDYRILRMVVLEHLDSLLDRALTLREVQEAAESFRRLTEAIERDPAMLIKGRRE